MDFLFFKTNKLSVLTNRLKINTNIKHQTWQFGSPKFGLTSKFDLYSVISYRINFGWIIIRHFYFDLISMEVRNISDFDLNFDGHSWTWIEAMKGFQEQMVSALAFKTDQFIKTVEHELILLQTLYWLTISIFMFQNTFKSALHVLFSSSSGFKS